MRRRRLILLCALVITCVVIAPSNAWAQTPVVNPTTIEWDPSPDHDVLGLDGQPLVTRYDVEIYLESQQTTPIVVFSADKPTPVAGKITVVNAAWFLMSALNLRHVAKVVAVGPTGVGRSTASNPFGTTGPPRPPSNPTVIRPPSGPDMLSGLSAIAW